MELLSTENYVECPYIQVTIGNNVIGSYKETKGKNMYGNTIAREMPANLKSLSVNKVNGTVNTYTIVFEYAVTPQRDPNYMETIFASIADTRMIKVSYGDFNNPTFMYKEEEAIVTNLTTAVDMSGAKLTYTMTAVSNSVSIKTVLWSFGAKYCKPSEEIISLLRNTQYGLQDVFTGMKDVSKVIKDGLIADDDKKVIIKAKKGINILDYISYLVSCMVCKSNTGTNKGLNDSIYHWAIFDDITKEREGTYFKVRKVPANSIDIESQDVFEVDVGFPNHNNVTQFAINNTETYSLLYKESLKRSVNYDYVIQDDGKIDAEESPAVYRDITNTLSESNRNWWTRVTSFPIQATLSIRGLLRPAMLMQYVRINCMFYGQRYIASGLYVITKQVDKVDQSGYGTTLTLLRINSDSNTDKYNYWGQWTSEEKDKLHTDTRLKDRI